MDLHIFPVFKFSVEIIFINVQIFPLLVNGSRLKLAPESMYCDQMPWTQQLTIYSYCPDLENPSMRSMGVPKRRAGRLSKPLPDSPHCFHQVSPLLKTFSLFLRLNPKSSTWFQSPA